MEGERPHLHPVAEQRRQRVAADPALAVRKSTGSSPAPRRYRHWRSSGVLRFLNVRPTQQHRRRHARRHQRDAVIPETLESAGQQALRHGFPASRLMAFYPAPPACDSWRRWRAPADRRFPPSSPAEACQPPSGGRRCARVCRAVHGLLRQRQVLLSVASVTGGGQIGNHRQPGILRGEFAGKPRFRAPRDRLWFLPNKSSSKLETAPSACEAGSGHWPPFAAGVAQFGINGGNSDARVSPYWARAASISANAFAHRGCCSARC